VLPGRQIFVVDTQVNVHPTAKELAEITIMAAGEVRGYSPIHSPNT
jgi:phosphotransacetylase